MVIKKIFAHPHDPRIIYAVAYKPDYYDLPKATLYKTVDGGQSWKVLPCDFSNSSFIGCDLVFHPHNPETLFAGNPKGFFRSEDGGESWKKLSEMALMPLVFSANNPGLMIAGRFQWQYTITEADVIYTSEDLGKTWKPIARMCRPSLNHQTGHPAVAACSGSYDQVTVPQLLVDAGDPATIVANVYFENRRDPGWLSWESGSIFSTRDWGGSWTQHGYGNISIEAMCLDAMPAPNLVALQGSRILCSPDWGKSFVRLYEFPKEAGYCRSLLVCSAVAPAGFYAATADGLYFSESLASGGKCAGLKGRVIYSLCESKSGSVLLVGTDDGLFAVSGLPLPDPPKIEIQSPSSGATVWGDLTVSALATDDAGISRTGLQVDGEEVASVEGSGSSRQELSFQWDTRKTGKGKYLLNVWAENSLGLKNYSTIDVNVENVLLELSAQPHWEKAWLVRKKTDHSDIILRVDNRGGLKDLRFKISWGGGERRFSAADLKNGVYKFLLPNPADSAGFTVSAWTDAPYIEHGYRYFYLKLR